MIITPSNTNYDSTVINNTRNIEKILLYLSSMLSVYRIAIKSQLNLYYIFCTLFIQMLHIFLVQYMVYIVYIYTKIIKNCEY